MYIGRLTDMKNNSLITGERITEKRVLDEIRKIYKYNYNENNTEFIETIFNDIMDLFSGKKQGFLKCDTAYHDLLHTLQVVFVFLKIINGWNQKEKTSRIPKKNFNIGVIAALLHDTGYIKTECDNDGTGGKYTFIHIQRGIDFARHYMSLKGFEENQIESVRNILFCTGLKIDYESFPFQSSEERIIGYALGTADLIAQMAANDYPEKLPLLYSEFEEAYRYEGIEKLKSAGALLYESVNDLIEKTPYFYEEVVEKRLKRMGSMYKYLSDHSKNHYIEAIEENIKRIKLSSMSQKRSIGN
jgi:hypothetical protein